MTKWMTEFVEVRKSDLKLPWSGGRNGKYFRCYFCGKKFVVGDEFRMIFTNNLDGIPGGNPLTCRPCFDEHEGAEGLAQLWKHRWVEVKEKFWWAGKFMLVE
jgi:hypothetical protein